MESTPWRHDDKPWTFLTDHARVLIVIAHVQALIELFTRRGESRAPAARAPAESR